MVIYALGHNIIAELPEQTAVNTFTFDWLNMVTPKIFQHKAMAFTYNNILLLILINMGQCFVLQIPEGLVKRVLQTEHTKTIYIGKGKTTKDYMKSICRYG